MSIGFVFCDAHSTGCPRIIMYQIGYHVYMVIQMCEWMCSTNV